MCSAAGDASVSGSAADQVSAELQGSTPCPSEPIVATPEPMSGATPTISVIVPVYKVEPYLRECVDSILAQSFRDFELLLIDDGSPDGCPQICDEYARQDARVRVFHRENGGLSAARNTGLNNMRGAYVAMVDSDDVLISRDYLKILYEELVRNRAEMALCIHEDFNDGEPAPSASVGSYEVFVRSGEDYVYWGNIQGPFAPNCAHGKLYRADLFAQVRYPEGRIFEDIATQHLLVFPRERIVFVGAALYGYRVRKDGIELGAPLEERAQDLIYALQDRIDYYNSVGRFDLADDTEQSMLKWLRKHL